MGEGSYFKTTRCVCWWVFGRAGVSGLGAAGTGPAVKWG